jgi:hypothetical protein
VPRLFIVSLAITLCSVSCSVEAASAKIKKVLSFYLDREGRQSLSPSLYERDAYQAELRRKPHERSGLRFDVQWNANTTAPLTLRVEARGANGTQNTRIVLERDVRKTGLFSRWTQLKMTGDEYRNFGDLVAWRVTLWQGSVLVSEQKSFLW